VGHPFLYRRDDPAKLLLGEGGRDVPRNAEGIAIIGDPRNDSHMLMTQLHVGMMKAHNAFVDIARGRKVADDRVFAWAARETRWHYQTAILEEFLPTLVGDELVDEVTRSGPRWFHPTDSVFIPLEFADAAYRYGHCQIRHRYQLNPGGPSLPVFPDLLGFRPVPSELHIDWTLFFDRAAQRTALRTAQRAKKIDGRLVRPLIHLPVAITGDTQIDEYHSLAVRDLQRGQGVGLPSGEAIARHIGEMPLSADEIGLNRAGWSGETPLWYYVLREAFVKSSGNRLGPVGARIVAEVIVTLLDRDASSVRFSPAGWQPRGALLDLLLQTPSLAA
jgi:hypothetical protein